VLIQEPASVEVQLTAKRFAYQTLHTSHLGHGYGFDETRISGSQLASPLITFVAFESAFVLTNLRSPAEPGGMSH